MKLKSYSKLILIVCFISFQPSILWSQISADQFFIDNSIGNPFNNLQYLYVAGSQNSMSIRESSDLKLSFRTIIWNQNNYDYDLLSTLPISYDSSPKWKVNVSDFTLSYSPLPHLYGTANLFILNKGEKTYESRSKIIMGDIGIGTYYLKKTKGIPFLKNKLKKLSKFQMTNKGLLMNVLAGYSRGNISYAPSYKVGKGEFILNRFYGKIGLDYQAGFIGIATDAKFGVLNFGKTTLLGHAYEDLISQSTLLYNENDFMFGEFSFRFYVGMKFGQIYINRITTKVKDEMKDFVLSDFWSVGAVLDIQDIFKKKIKNEKIEILY